MIEDKERLAALLQLRRWMEMYQLCDDIPRDPTIYIDHKKLAKVAETDETSSHNVG